MVVHEKGFDEVHAPHAARHPSGDRDKTHSRILPMNLLGVDRTEEALEIVHRIFGFRSLKTDNEDLHVPGLLLHLSDVDQLEFASPPPLAIRRHCPCK